MNVITGIDMKKIKDILRELQYYLSIRKIGKTTLLKKGVDDYPFYHWIVVPTIEYGKNIITPSNKLHKLVSLNSLENIRGTQQAMIIDQEANLQIFSMALSEIEQLEEQNRKQNGFMHEITDLAEMYQNDLHQIQNHMLDGLQIPFWNISAKIQHQKKSMELASYSIKRSKEFEQKFEKLKSYYRVG
jgi:hypothetical protein